MVKAKVKAATFGAAAAQALAALALLGFDFGATADHWVHGIAGVVGAFAGGYGKTETLPD